MTCELSRHLQHINLYYNDWGRGQPVVVQDPQGATLKIYPGAPHGMCTTLKQQVNEELLAFFKA